MTRHRMSHGSCVAKTRKLRGNTSMSFWVDTNAYPQVITDRLSGVADRWHIALTLVTHQPLHAPTSAANHVLRLAVRCDGASYTIIRHVCAGDLVETAEIPLIAQVVANDAHALNSMRPLGDAGYYLHDRLTRRHVRNEPCQSGVETGGPFPFSPRGPGKRMRITSRDDSHTRLGQDWTPRGKH